MSIYLPECNRSNPALHIYAPFLDKLLFLWFLLPPTISCLGLCYWAKSKAQKFGDHTCFLIKWEPYWNNLVGRLAKQVDEMT